ncbi:hypothetical protein E1295_06100 [Nonomuraea mesophila]|uniref:DUF6879 domain-containing protein n=1 Tax=Nonomuraea mesophila TaxID=2530382 RepID=A0A4R5FV29_9ACTN|nr:DUF6879 family protein [Nonomuraea mesophila]TDE58177.1 hypothetical protein E1295_06100 [Nonomuraea mesophila]
MLDRIHQIPAVLLGADDYLDDFWPSYRRTDDVVWKLQRVQGFDAAAGPGALVQGDWERSLKLAGDGRAAAAGFARRRLRIVEPCITSYLRWEMHVLASRGQVREEVRVLAAQQVADLEIDRRLPELVVLGTSVMYEVTYDALGAHSGARRIDDQEVIAACRGELDKLFAAGETLEGYYEREIVPLTAPRVPT